MLVSDRFTIGQVTFFLRALIQGLSFAGLFLIGTIIVSHTPRIASLSTHDTVNRIISYTTVTISSLKWIYNRLRHRTADPALSTGLLISIVLLTVYSLFVSLSDVGFLGFHTCDVPGASYYDQPGSINSTSLALATFKAASVNGADPSNITASRCDAVSTVAGTGTTCVAWRNSTFADANLFNDLNTTDSDILIPSRLESTSANSSFVLSFGGERINKVTIKNGILVEPHEYGVRAVFGVPNLPPQTAVTLDKILAFEFEMGCIDLGINYSLVRDGLDLFQVNWPQPQRYSGPDHMKDILTKFGGDIRNYYLPLFTQSSQDPSVLQGNNSNLTLTGSPAGTAISSRARIVIGGFGLPDVGEADGSDMDDIFSKNCTKAISTAVNLTLQMEVPCQLVVLTGSSLKDGFVEDAASRMICATTAQVNMVSALITSDVQGTLHLANMNRQPSDMHYLLTHPYNSTTMDGNSAPVERFTLSDNPTGPVSHFIPIWQWPTTTSALRLAGSESGGNTLSRIDIASVPEELEVLDDPTSPPDFDSSSKIVTQWGGQVAASFLLQSAMYNGWAALAAKPILVTSTGGKLATCYHPIYALGFLPLALSALIVLAWALHHACTARSYKTKSGRVEEICGGLNPLQKTLYPESDKDTLLTWQASPEPHLAVLPLEEPIVLKDQGMTLLKYLNSIPSKSDSSSTVRRRRSSVA